MTFVTRGVPVTKIVAKNERPGDDLRMAEEVIVTGDLLQVVSEDREAVKQPGLL